jgi:hypothetical protein
MENLDPRQVQTNKVTVIKLGRIDDVDNMNKCSKFHWDRAKGSVPTTTWNITLLWLFMHGFSLALLALSYYFLAHLHRSNGWIDFHGWWLKRCVSTQGSAFSGVSLKKFDLTGSVTPKTAKSGRGLWFPSQTRKFNKNSYLSQIKRYRHKIWTIGGNQTVHIRFRVKGHLSSNPRWRQPPLWKNSNCNNSINFRLIPMKFDE